MLKDLAETKSIAFKGNQKGDQLNLKSVSVDSMDESAPKYELSGKLDANTGLMASVLASSDAQKMPLYTSSQLSRRLISRSLYLNFTALKVEVSPMAKL